jgi:hypothetical protein
MAWGGGGGGTNFREFGLVLKILQVNCYEPFFYNNGLATLRFCPNVYRWQWLNEGEVSIYWCSHTS